MDSLHKDIRKSLPNNRATVSVTLIFGVTLVLIATCLHIRGALLHTKERADQFIGIFSIINSHNFIFALLRVL